MVVHKNCYKIGNVYLLVSPHTDGKILEIIDAKLKNELINSIEMGYINFMPPLADKETDNEKSNRPRRKND